jgi:hypothetical protein
MHAHVSRFSISSFLAILGLSLAVVRADGLVTAQHSSDGYRSPGICQVTCEFAYPTNRSLLSLAWLVTLPPGWQITSVAGNGTPEVQGSDIVFLGSLTNRPIQFSYTLSVPSGETGVKALSGSAEYILNGMTNQAMVITTPDPLPLSQQLQLLVTSDYGRTIPPMGTNIYNSATNLYLAVTNSPVPAGETQYVCTGWTGTGSLASGTGTNTELAITNDSEVLWLWKTQYALVLSNTVGGSVTDVSGWHDSGSNVTVTATAAAHYQFYGWMGQTNGCTLVGDQITIPMDKPRHLSAKFLLDSHSLEVSSPYGNPQPAVGTEHYEYGTTVPCSLANSPATFGETQYVCTGWAGTGSVIPGEGTNTEVAVTINSTLVWLWKTQYFITATQTVGGTVTDVNGWYDLGDAVQMTALAYPHYHFIGWEGQTNGCQVEGDQITVPVDQVRHVQARFELDIHTLTVSSEHGRTVPPEGTNSYSYGLTVSCSVTNSPVIDGSNRYVCTGWTGSGSVAAGSGTNMQFVLTNDSTLAWLWETQYWLAVTNTSGGYVAYTSGWVDSTQSVTVTAVADAHRHFSGWQGATNACIINGEEITIPMNQPRSIIAMFAWDLNFLEVSSLYGDPVPGVGTNYYDYGTAIPCAVTNSPVQDNDVRYVCLGWTGWGSVWPGSGTNTQIILTNNSGIVWQWKTQFWMTAIASMGGSVSISNGWQDQGSSVVITATAYPHYYFAGWNGQTDGCSVVSNQITAPMDRPREITALFELDQHTLRVNSLFGTAVPPVGTNILSYGTNLVCSIADSPVVDVTTQYFCSGWAGVGSVPYSGTQTNTPIITLTSNSMITWKWGTNVWLSLAAGPGGSIKTNRQSAWYGIRTTVSNIEATATTNYHFTKWTGDTNGIMVTTNKISAYMSGTRSLIANFAVDEFRVVVNSQYGAPTPPKGTNYVVYGSNIFCAIPNSPVISGLTQLVCRGWSGSGCVPPSGVTTNTGWFTVTNHSTITWKWGTNYWLGLSQSPGGSLDRTSGWYTAGMVTNITATPSNHYHFGGWTGDTNGCVVAGNWISFLMSRSRILGASFVLDTHRLVVTTPYGTASPATGTNFFEYGTVLAPSILDSPVTVGGIRYLCTGWTGTGSVASVGTGTNTDSFSLDQDSRIDWTWRTQYLFSAACDAGGVLEGPVGWQNAGAVVTAEVSATYGFTFDRWLGDVPAGMELNNPIEVTLDQARSIYARIRVDTNLIRAAHSAPGYRSPEVGRTVTCSFECPTNRYLLSLAWLVTLPEGWQITSVTGNGSPEVQGSEIVFLGGLLTNRVNFSYTLSIPGNASTTNNVEATADFQLDGMANSVGLPANPAPLLLSRYHSADYKTSYWTIDASEVSRFLSYWRAGGYQVNVGGFDGFMAGAGNTNGGYHSADYLPTRWVITGTEVNRVLAYWRGGGYHVDPAGNDGYVVGPPSQGMGLSAMGSSSFQSSQDGPLAFDPGQTLTISNVYTYTGTLWSLLCRPRLPRGWVIMSVTGDGIPEFSLGEIVWTGTLPPSPIHLVYTVSIPDSECRARQITAEVEYQLSDMLNENTATPLPPVLGLTVCDQDSDGLPDKWENTYGGGSTNLMPDADDDGDGMANGKECIAGTNPNDADSVLKVDGCLSATDDGQVLSWVSSPNHWYTLGRSFNLMDGFSPLATNLPAIQPMNCYTDHISQVTPLFYRVEVEP